jgi:hypothetical protein
MKINIKDFQHAIRLRKGFASIRQGKSHCEVSSGVSSYVVTHLNIQYLYKYVELKHKKDPEAEHL